MDASPRLTRITISPLFCAVAPWRETSLSQFWVPPISTVASGHFCKRLLLQTVSKPARDCLLAKTVDLLSSDSSFFA